MYVTVRLRNCIIRISCQHAPGRIRLFPHLHKAQISLLSFGAQIQIYSLIPQEIHDGYAAFGFVQFNPAVRTGGLNPVIHGNHFLRRNQTV